MEKSWHKSVYTFSIYTVIDEAIKKLCLTSHFIMPILAVILLNSSYIIYPMDDIIIWKAIYSLGNYIWGNIFWERIGEMSTQGTYHDTGWWWHDFHPGHFLAFKQRQHVPSVADNCVNHEQKMTNKRDSITNIEHIWKIKHEGRFHLLQNGI